MLLRTACVHLLECIISVCLLCIGSTDCGMGRVRKFASACGCRITSLRIFISTGNQELTHTRAVDLRMYPVRSPRYSLNTLKIHALSFQQCPQWPDILNTYARENGYDFSARQSRQRYRRHRNTTKRSLIAHHSILSIKLKTLLKHQGVNVLHLID